MIWDVFRQSAPGEYHTHCGVVHAPDAEMAELYARVQHGRRKRANSLWVVPRSEVHEVDIDSPFRGATDRSYRFATAYAAEPAAEEVAESEVAQREEQEAEE